MILVCHLIYALVFIGFSSSIAVPSKEVYDTLSEKKKKYYQNGPYIIIALLYVFVLMDFIIMQVRPDAFGGKIFPHIVGATYGAVMILANWKDKHSLPKQTIWLAPLLYFIYTLILNAPVMKTIFYIFDFLLAEVGSLAIMALLTFNAYHVVDSITIKTEFELREEARIREEERKRREEEKRQEEEYRKMQEERERQMEAREAQMNRSHSRSNDSGGFFDSFLTSLEEEKERKDVFGTGQHRRCSNCTYLENGYCRLSMQRVFNPQYENCGQHQY